MTHVSSPLTFNINIMLTNQIMSYYATLNCQKPSVLEAEDLPLIYIVVYQTKV